MLASSHLGDPLFWAVLVGWIMTVVLHEFAHGLVAWLGGDYTIRERGGLTLNPLQYVDPIFSILLPLLFLLLGSVPLPGGVTYIRFDLLRNRLWRSAVSAAGPAMNFLLFLACVLPLHPRFHWLDTSTEPTNWRNSQLLLAALGMLQMLAVLLNLLPLPPLDGFGIISPLLPKPIVERLTAPGTQMMLMTALFMVLWLTPGLMSQVYVHVMKPLLEVLGFRYNEVNFLRQAYNTAMTGGTD